MNIDVITYCTGYEFYVFDRFVGSLCDTGFTGIIHLIIRDHDVDHVKQLIQMYPRINGYIDRKPQTTHINCHKFLCIKDYMEQNQISSDYLFICDSRDVLFQKNISSYPLDPSVDLVVFAENLKICQDMSCNTYWLQQLEQIMKEEIYYKIRRNDILCCGTTLGKTNAIKQYIDEMCSIIQKYNIKTNLDQGIHNYLIHKEKLPLKVMILTNIDNLVNTVGIDVQKVIDGKIVNSKDEVSYIVHQYDRFSKEKKEELPKKYNFVD